MILKMLRAKKEIAYEGMVPALKDEEAGQTADSTTDLLAMMEVVIREMNWTNGRLQALV